MIEKSIKYYLFFICIFFHACQIEKQEETNAIYEDELADYYEGGCDVLIQDVSKNFDQHADNIFIGNLTKIQNYKNYQLSTFQITENLKGKHIGEVQLLQLTTTKVKLIEGNTYLVYGTPISYLKNNHPVLEGNRQKVISDQEIIIPVTHILPPLSFYQDTLNVANRLTAKNTVELNALTSSPIFYVYSANILSLDALNAQTILEYYKKK